METKPQSQRDSALLGAVRGVARAWTCPVDDGQAARLLDYAELLLAWNARINLTAAGSVQQVVAEHLPDSFALASRLAGGLSVVDVGSGGGMPAVPLALLRPELRLTLVEPIAKKVAFLRTAVRELDLGDRVEVQASRGEVLAAARPGTFDAAVSRATLPPEEWLVLGQQLVRPGGRVFVLTTPGGGSGIPRELVRSEVTYLGGRRLMLEVARG